MKKRLCVLLSFLINLTGCSFLNISIDSSSINNSTNANTSSEVSTTNNDSQFNKVDYLIKDDLKYVLNRNKKSYSVAGVAKENILEVNVPDSVNSFPVTEVYEGAFINQKSIKKIVLPDSIVELGYQSFLGCESLEQITMSKNIKIIGDSSFANCSSLKSIVLPDNLEKIMYGAFKNCYSLESIKIPNKVRDIDFNTFENCYSLSEVTLSSNLLTIGSEAFKGCNSLLSITLPSSLKSINEGAFYECYSLYEVYNESNLKILKNNANHGFVSFYARIIHNQNGSYSYRYDVETEIVEKDGFMFTKDEKNGYRLFKYVGNASDINLPDNVDGKNYQIDSYAFYRNEKLKDLTVPSFVKNIEVYTFAYCKNLRTVKVDGAQYIKEGAFYECRNIEKVTLAEALLGIGKSAFFQCEKIETLYIPRGVTTFEYCAFSHCLGLKNITLPPTLAEIGIGSFSHCKSLETLVIPTSVAIIGVVAFFNCDKLSLFSELDSMPRGWDDIDRPVYFDGEWEYVNGVPTVK